MVDVVDDVDVDVDVDDDDDDDAFDKFDGRFMMMCGYDVIYKYSRTGIRLMFVS